MACSQFEYVQKFEETETLLPNTYIVLRIDGKGFTIFTTEHEFEKPNDKRGLDLMNKCAEKVMQTFSQIFLAYGQSDEYSFIFRRDTTLFSRRREKILSCVVSCFTAAFVLSFKTFFPDKELKSVPMFDGRCVCYPSQQNLIDYVSWRQADCHINNLYNTCFWNMVKSGQSNQEVEKILQDTKSGEKNEILFSQFGINYNTLPNQFKKGSILIRLFPTEEQAKLQSEVKQNDAPNEQINQEINEIKNNQKDLGEDQQLMNQQQQEKSNELENIQQSQDQASENKNNQQSKQKKEKIFISQPQFKQKISIIYQDMISQEFWVKYRDSLDLDQ